MYRAAVLAAQHSLRRTAVPSLTALRCFLTEFLVRPHDGRAGHSRNAEAAKRHHCNFHGSTAVQPRRLLCPQAAAYWLDPLATHVV